MTKTHFVTTVNWAGGPKMKKKLVDLEKRGVIIITDFLVTNTFKSRGDVDSC